MPALGDEIGKRIVDPLVDLDQAWTNGEPADQGRAHALHSRRMPQTRPSRTAVELEGLRGASDQRPARREGEDPSGLKFGDLRRERSTLGGVRTDLQDDFLPERGDAYDAAIEVPARIGCEIAKRPPDLHRRGRDVEDGFDLDHLVAVVQAASTQSEQTRRDSDSLNTQSV